MAAIFLLRGAWSVRTTVDLLNSEIRRTTMLLLVVPLWLRRIPFAAVRAIDINHSSPASCQGADDGPRATFSIPTADFYGLAIGGLAHYLSVVLGDLSIGFIDLGHYHLRIETRDHRNPLVYRSYQREPTVRHAETLARILQVRLT
jgi:hypothetical protein